MRFIPFLRADLASTLPTPVNEREFVGLELEGFPEYIADLSPEQSKLIDDLALKIIASNQTNDPIFEFRVEGHADIARRIGDLKERKWFEDNISRERAENGFNLLVEAIERKSGNKALAHRIAHGSRAFGLGTQQLKVPNASTEAEFRRNRRIVFIMRQVTMIPPPPQPTPPPSSVIEDRYSVRLIKGGVVTVGMPTAKFVPVVPTSTTFIVTLEIKDNIDRKVASFNVSATGVGLGGGPTPIGGSVTFTAGPEVKFKTFRLLGRFSAAPKLDDFVGSVTVFMDTDVGLGPVSKGGTLSFSFDALESNGMNTNPTVIPVPGGSVSFSVPGFDLGAVAPLGRMTMMGSPSSF